MADERERRLRWGRIIAIAIATFILTALVTKAVIAFLNAPPDGEAELAAALMGQDRQFVWRMLGRPFPARPDGPWWYMDYRDPGKVGRIIRKILRRPREPWVGLRVGFGEDKMVDSVRFQSVGTRKGTEYRAGEDGKLSATECEWTTWSLDDDDIEETNP